MSDDYDYSEDSIQVLEGLEAVRRRPGMYVGNTDDGSGLHNMVYEVLGYALEEVRAGYGDRIVLTIHGDREVTVEDRGRGIPVGLHAGSGVSCVEVILTTLHGGGVFDQDVYRSSSGLYCVGLPAVNALSERLVVDVFRDGAHWRQRHERGVPCGPLERLGGTSNTGTRVRFRADTEIFVDPVFDFDVLAERLEALAWMHPEVVFELFDHRDDRHASFHTPGGMVEALTGGRETGAVVYACATHDGVLVELALRPMCRPSVLRTFVNGLETYDHGAHLRGLQRALHGVLLADSERPWRDVFDANGVGGASILRESFDVMLHVCLPDPRFSGCTRRELASPEVREAVAQVAAPVLEAWVRERGGAVDRVFEGWSPV
jgi:DNA gyrase subunit B